MKHKFFWFILGIVIFFLLFGLFIRCSVVNEIIKEDKLYITRIYVGQFIDTFHKNGEFRVMTEKDIFHILCDSDIHIPKNASCFIKLEEYSRIGGERGYKPYFTWDSSEIRIPIHFNPWTGDLH